MALPNKQVEGPITYTPGKPLTGGVSETVGAIASPAVGVAEGAANTVGGFTNLFAPQILEEIMKQYYLTQGLNNAQATQNIPSLVYDKKKFEETRLPVINKPIKDVKEDNPFLSGLGDFTGSVLSAYKPLTSAPVLGLSNSVAGGGVLGGLLGAGQEISRQTTQDVNQQGQPVRGFDRYKENVDLGRILSNAGIGYGLGVATPFAVQKGIQGISGAANLLGKGLITSQQQKIGDIAQGEFKTAGDVYKKLEAVGQDLQKQSTKLTKQYDKLAKDKESLISQLQQGIGANPQFAQTAEGQALQGQLDDLNIQGYNTQAQLKDINYKLEHATTKGSIPSKAVPGTADSKELLNILPPHTRQLLGGGVGQRAAQEIKPPLQEGPPVNTGTSTVDELFPEQAKLFDEVRQEDLSKVGDDVLERMYNDLPTNTQKMMSFAGQLMKDAHNGAASFTNYVLRRGARLSDVSRIYSNIGLRGAKFMHDMVDFTVSKRNQIEAKMLNPLLNQAEKAGILAGGTEDRLLFDIGNSVEGDILLKELPKLVGKTKDEVQKALYKLVLEAKGKLSLDEAQSLNLGATLDDLEKGTLNLGDDFVTLLNDTIKTNKNLIKADGLDIKDIPKAYMHRVWKGQKPLNPDQFLEALKNNKHGDLIAQEKNPRYLQERYGSAGYEQSWTTSVRKRISDHAKKQAYDPALQAVRRIISEGGNIHPFVKEMAKDFALSLSGATSKSKSAAADWVGGNLIKNLLNTEGFGLINSLQNVLTYSEYGPNVFNQARGFWSNPKTKQAAQELLKDDIGLFGAHSTASFSEGWGFRREGTQNVLPQGVREGYKDFLGKNTTRGMREGADLFFNRGPLLSGTEDNNVAIAALSSLANHFKMPLDVLQKKLKNNPELQEEAGIVAQKAVNKLIFINNDLDKTLLQGSTLGSLGSAFTKFPIAGTSLLLDWGKNNPQALARWGNIQNLYGGADAIIPEPIKGLFNQVDYAGAKQGFESLNPSSNLPNKNLGINLGSRINTAGTPAFGSLLGSVIDYAQQIFDPKVSEGDKVSAAVFLGVPTQVGVSPARLLKIMKDFSGNPFGDTALNQAARYGEGREVTKTDPKTGRQIKVEIKNPSDQYLDSIGLSKYGNDAVLNANVIGNIYNDYEDIVKLDKKGDKSQSFEEKSQALEKRADIATTTIASSYINQGLPPEVAIQKAKQDVNSIFDNVDSKFQKADVELFKNKYKHYLTEGKDEDLDRLLDEWTAKISKDSPTEFLRTKKSFKEYIKNLTQETYNYGIKEEKK